MRPDVTLKFTQEHLAILNEGLVRLPYAQVAALINEINQQIADQQGDASVPSAREAEESGGGAATGWAAK